MKLPGKHDASWLVTMASVGLAVIVLCSLADWHSWIKPSTAKGALQSTRRFLLQVEASDKTIDDDITRDDTCRDYLMNFLNGTTDAKDECQAMNKAWEVADCGDYSDKKKHSSNSSHEHAFNHTNDDIMIDDAFEKWECCSSISDFYSRRCEVAHWDAYKLLGIVLVLIVCGWMKSLLRIARIQWIPDAGACIIVGAVVGGILRLAQTNLVQDKLLAFDNDLFLQIMLPPIIFQASISIDKRAFRRDLFPILAFAVVGTGFSAVAIGYITHSLSSIGGGEGLPLLDSLLFGALMSSIDPVATLGILSSVGVSQGDTLYTLIFGESLLNDGVAIVLFESLVRHMGDASVVDQATVQDTLFHFTFVTFGSILCGVLCGVCCTWYFWALQGKQTAVGEVALFFAWALVPYYIADGFGFSGIIAIMVMGFMLDYYVIGGHQSDEGEWMEYMEMRCNHENDGSSHPVEPCFEKVKLAFCKAFSGRGLILSRSRHHVGFVAEVLSNLMETAIFAYLGLFLFNDKVWIFKWTISGLFACVSSRAVMVIALSLVINACVWIDLEGLLNRCWRKCCLRGNINLNNDDDSAASASRVYLDVKTQMILFSAGVRGAVSYALVQNVAVYDAVTKHGSHYKAELKSMTSATIVVILFVFGALTYFTVQRDMNPQRERVAGTLTHRLLSIGLASEEGDEHEGSDLNSTFEIEGRQSVRFQDGNREEQEYSLNLS